jgi:Flp pilus assembly protein TadD
MGRNDPCPCGSGKKYKRCCLDKDQTTARAERARTTALAEQQQREAFAAAQSLDDASNSILDLIRAGELDAAEVAARELLVRYPEAPDGHERLGIVYEARGDHGQAAECYRRVIEFIGTQPGQFDPEYERYLLEKIELLAAN